MIMGFKLQLMSVAPRDPARNNRRIHQNGSLLGGITVGEFFSFFFKGMLGEERFFSVEFFVKKWAFCEKKMNLWMNYFCLHSE